MATSPNYAWAEPDNSSLVKNGASDIRTLGDAIDTSVWNVGFGQAGKNKIINGDFSVNQRSFTSTSTDNLFNFDRWLSVISVDPATVSAQTFTPGTAPVAGYESTNFFRCVTSGQVSTTSRQYLLQRIEDVRTFAAQTVTVSFWAKAASGTPKIGSFWRQNFGTGGSTTLDVSVGSVTISTSWARYSLTYAVPSVSGKTIGAGSHNGLYLVFSQGSAMSPSTGVGLQNGTFDIWGVQVEYGSKATPFQTASGGNPQQELAMCQRYYYRNTSGTTYGAFGLGQTVSTDQARIPINLPVTMRTNVASLEYANVSATNASDAVVTAPTSLTINYSGANVVLLSFAATGAFAGAGGSTVFRANNSTTAYIAFSAEL